MGNTANNNTNPLIRAVSREQLKASIEAELRLSRLAVVQNCLTNLHHKGFESDPTAISVALGAIPMQAEIQMEAAQPDSDSNVYDMAHAREARQAVQDAVPRSSSEESYAPTA